MSKKGSNKGSLEGSPVSQYAEETLDSDFKLALALQAQEEA